MRCRHCAEELTLPFVDLGSAPPSNAYVTSHSLKLPEKWYPLRVLVCKRCWLVQTDDCATPDEMFGPEYAYFSSISTTWLAHAERYVSEMVDRFALNKHSHVVEIAANDGYLLQFVTARGIPCTGVEPTAGTAAAAREKGIPIVQEFFGVRLANELVGSNRSGNLIVANNVLAHVPEINDFVAGIAVLLVRDGVATFEFPHLMKLVAGIQFDTIYHEHFSYLSLIAVDRIFNANGLAVFDVEEHTTHGGSLRVFAQRADSGKHIRTSRVTELLEREERAGLRTPDYYSHFQLKTDTLKNDFVRFLLDAKQQQKKVAGYGAAAKGNTLINYAGVRPDLLPYVADASAAKQGKFMPGSRIPIVSEDHLRRDRPDYVVILPWNLRAEITEQVQYTREWGGTLVTAVPHLELC